MGFSPRSSPQGRRHPLTKLDILRLQTHLNQGSFTTIRELQEICATHVSMQTIGRHLQVPILNRETYRTVFVCDCVHLRTASGWLQPTYSVQSAGQGPYNTQWIRRKQMSKHTKELSRTSQEVKLLILMETRRPDASCNAANQPILSCLGDL